jgi:hypothetical protein
MPEIKGPGAHAGATGAGCLRAAAFGPQHIARPEGLRHHGGALALRLARLRRLGLAWGAADG